MKTVKCLFIVFRNNKIVKLNEKKFRIDKWRQNRQKKIREMFIRLFGTGITVQIAPQMMFEWWWCFQIHVYLRYNFYIYFYESFLIAIILFITGKNVHCTEIFIFVPHLWHCLRPENATLLLLFKTHLKLNSRCKA